MRYLLQVLMLLLYSFGSFAQYSFESDEMEVEEGKTAYVKVTFAKSGAGKTVRILATKSTTAGAKDYETGALPGELNFLNSPPSQIFPIKILDDGYNEDDESIFLNLEVEGDVVDSLQIKIVDQDNTIDFFRGAIGGNVNFADKKLQVNSVYVDLTFIPSLPFKLPIPFTKKTGYFRAVAPVRAFYNNGSGPQEVTTEHRTGRYFTIDTNFVDDGGSKKVKYWDDSPKTSYSIETRNLGINVPILLYWTFPNVPSVSLIAGYNFEFASITKRTYNIKYVTDVLDSNVVSKFADVPLPEERIVTRPDGSTFKFRDASIYYRSQLYRPNRTESFDANYFQIFQAFTFGISYSSKRFECTLKHSIGNTFTYNQVISSLGDNPYNYNKNFQLIFLEKRLGIQLLFDLRLPKRPEKNSILTSNYPTYYVSFAKTLNLSGLKEIFFP